MHARAASWYKSVPSYLSIKGIRKGLCANKAMTQYRGQECQLSHWRIHKHDCTSRLRKDSWKPGWELAGREPVCMGSDEEVIMGPAFVPDTYGIPKYLWGNVPAIDMLNLTQNEGLDYSKDLRLLSAGTHSSLKHLRQLTPFRIWRHTKPRQDASANPTDIYRKCGGRGQWQRFWHCGTKCDSSSNGVSLQPRRSCTSDAPYLVLRFHTFSNATIVTRKAVTTCSGCVYKNQSETSRISTSENVDLRYAVIAPGPHEETMGQSPYIFRGSKKSFSWAGPRSPCSDDASSRKKGLPWSRSL